MDNLPDYQFCDLLLPLFFVWFDIQKEKEIVSHPPADYPDCFADPLAYWNGIPVLEIYRLQPSLKLFRSHCHEALVA